MKQYPHHSAVILVGNNHVKLTLGNSEDVTYEPLAYRLKSYRKFQIISPVHAAGTAWVCMAPTPDGCGISKVRAAYSKNAADLPDPGVGMLSFSPPAVSLAAPQ